MAVVARSHLQQLLIRRLHSSIRNISLPRSNGETQGTCRRVPLKTSSTMYCSGKRHTGSKKHLGSKPSKQVTGACLQQSILMILIILHLPDGRPNALADAMQVPCLSPGLSLLVPTLPGPSLPVPRPSQTFMLLFVANRKAESLAKSKSKRKEFGRRSAVRQPPDSEPDPTPLDYVRVNQMTMNKLCAAGVTQRQPINGPNDGEPEYDIPQQIYMRYIACTPPAAPL